MKSIVSQLNIPHKRLVECKLPWRMKVISWVLRINCFSRTSDEEYFKHCFYGTDDYIFPEDFNGTFDYILASLGDVTEDFVKRRFIKEETVKDIRETLNLSKSKYDSMINDLAERFRLNIPILMFGLNRFQKMKINQHRNRFAMKYVINNDKDTTEELETKIVNSDMISLFTEEEKEIILNSDLETLKDIFINASIDNETNIPIISEYKFNADMMMKIRKYMSDRKIPDYDESNIESVAYYNGGYKNLLNSPFENNLIKLDPRYIDSLKTYVRKTSDASYRYRFEYDPRRYDIDNAYFDSLRFGTFFTSDRSITLGEFIYIIRVQFDEGFIKNEYSCSSEIRKYIDNGYHRYCIFEKLCELGFVSMYCLRKN